MHRKILMVLSCILSLIPLWSCSGKFDLSKHLSAQPPIDYTSRFDKQLPYRDLVLSIHLQELREMTPSQFHKFSEALYLIHKEATEFTLEELNLPHEIRSKVFRDLSQNKPELANYYLKELSKIEPYAITTWGEEQVLSYPYYTSVDKFAEVASANITFVLNTFLGFITHGVANKITLAAATKPFQVILYQALLPIVEKLRNEALLLDHVNARIKIKKHLRKLIAQLATVEDKFTSEDEIHPTRKFLIFTSRADILCHSTATVKAGFDLIKKFIVDIDTDLKIVKVYLPNPEILSFDVYTVYKSIEDGFLIDADETHLNELQSLIRRRLRQVALQSGILDSARKNAEEIVERILRPMMQTPYFNYKVRIYFD